MALLRHDRSIPVGSLARTVLLVDADPEPAGDLVADLAALGVAVAVCPDGAEALLSLGTSCPEVILLAPGTPLLTRPAFVRVLRRRHRMPVIVGVDANAADAATCLAAGATSCISWPFTLVDVLPLLAVTSRANKPTVVTPPSNHAVLRAGEILVDEVAHEVRISGHLVHLPLREFNLLTILVRNAETVVPVDFLLDTIWGPGGGRESNTLEVHIRRLRLRLGDDPHRPHIIHTIRGLGYRLDPPAARPPTRQRSSTHPQGGGPPPTEPG